MWQESWKVTFWVLPVSGKVKSPDLMRSAMTSE